MQNGVLRRIEEKEHEHDSFEFQISNVNFPHIDEREKNMVLWTYLFVYAWFSLWLSKAVEPSAWSQLRKHPPGLPNPGIIRCQFLTSG